MKVAVLGPKGTFCDKAFAEYKIRYGEKLCMEGRAAGEPETLEVTYCPTIDEVFELVCSPENESDAAELGIVPIENTLDGYVMRTLDLLLEKEVRIIDENLVPVQFSLVANAGSREEIETIYVQFKANGQCRQFINSMKQVKLITTESNMESYYSIGDKKGAAAIVPKHIADAESGRFVIENVTDADKNYTRFVLFRRGSVENTRSTASLAEVVEGAADRNTVDGVGQAEKISASHSGRVRIPVYIMPTVDRPGLLYAILRIFYEHQINLISIMSRPTKQEMGTYNFYIEIDGLREMLDTILDTLSQIEVYNDIKILGIYDERI